MSELTKGEEQRAKSKERRAKSEEQKAKGKGQKRPTQQAESNSINRRLFALRSLPFALRSSLFALRRGYIMALAKKLGLVVSLILVVLTTLVVLLKRDCPTAGIAFSQEERDFHRLKNRTALPQPADFETSATLSSLLQPGDDRGRWSASRAARVEGYVVSIGKGPIELVNCYLPWSRDTHINVALTLNAPVREQVVLEITPRMEAWAKDQGQDWSLGALNRELLGHWCSFEGWFFFDSNHAAEAENTAPQASNIWRATAWEIHPVTRFEAIK
jgi:hypothetical protein